jgi:mannose-1-phosphate guanylyltransferase
MSPQIRKAFVLGAGLGARLRPLTNILPKPLLPIFGKPIITFALDHLRNVGVSQIAINTHHLAHHFDALFPRRCYPGLSIELFHEPELLETGGGIKNVEGWVGDEPFLVYSGDLVTDIDIRFLIDRHFEDGNDATLALRRTGLSTSVAYDAESRRVVDIVGALSQRSFRSDDPTNVPLTGSYDFAGISIWNPTLFDQIQAGLRVSMASVLIDWMRTGARIGGVLLDSNQWFNIGSRGEYFTVHEIIRREAWSPSYLAEDVRAWPPSLHSSARVAPGAITGTSWVGAECLVQSNVTLQNSFLWPGSKVWSNTRLIDCIVAGTEIGPGEFRDKDFLP